MTAVFGMIALLAICVWPVFFAGGMLAARRHRDSLASLVPVAIDKPDPTAVTVHGCGGAWGKWSLVRATTKTITVQEVLGRKVNETTADWQQRTCEGCGFTERVRV
jgi:hypothetical protein